MSVSYAFMPVPPRTESDFRALPSREDSEYLPSIRWQASFEDDRTSHRENRLAVVSSHTVDRSLFILLLLIFVVGLLSSIHGMGSKINALEARIFRQARDNTGRRDFALRYGGGRINHALTTQTQPPPSMKGDSLNPAIQAIDDDLRPGRCWLLDGHAGQIGIEFLEAIVITHVTIDHVAKELVSASSLENAPRTMRVWGFGGSTGLPKQDINAIIDPQAGINSTSRPAIIQHNLSFSYLGSIEYDIRKDDNIQTFPISQAAMAMKLQFQGIVVEILDNWGRDSTCLYRVRVHGWQI